MDVRAPIVLEREGMIDSAINIELDSLRQNLDKLDKNKPVVMYCARGLRGYVGAMILQNHGFRKIFNLGGGFKTWEMMGMEVVSYSTKDN